VLKFTPERARWIRGETWHPMQETREDSDGSFELSVPYADEREIVADILKFGPDVTVVGPRELRQKVQQAALALVSRYV
jgi:predicted DNA-binding transcriptional regulator YafY